MKKFIFLSLLLISSVLYGGEKDDYEFDIKPNLENIQALVNEGEDYHKNVHVENFKNTTYIYNVIEHIYLQFFGVGFRNILHVLEVQSMQIDKQQKQIDSLKSFIESAHQ